MKILGMMQRKAAIWITGAFRTSPTGGVQAIAGLLPIHLHIRKLSWRASFWTATLSATHPARSLMGADYRGDAEEHPLAISQLTPRQLAAVRGSIVDANDALPPLADVFEPCAPENRPGQCLLDLFPDRVGFFHRKDFPKADTPPPSPGTPNVAARMMWLHDHVVEGAASAATYLNEVRNQALSERNTVVCITRLFGADVEAVLVYLQLGCPTRRCRVDTPVRRWQGPHT